jgi:hypothetical protein
MQIDGMWHDHSGFLPHARLPAPIDLSAGGRAALFAFDTAGDEGGCTIALRSVTRALAAILPDAPDAGVAVSAGTVAVLRKLVPPDPFRPRLFVVQLEGPRLVLCATLRLWSRVAPRTAVIGATADALTDGLLSVERDGSHPTPHRGICLCQGADGGRSR